MTMSSVCGVQNVRHCSSQMRCSYQWSLWATLGDLPSHQKCFVYVPVGMRNVQATVMYTLNIVYTREGGEAMALRGPSSPGSLAYITQVNSHWAGNRALSQKSESCVWMEETSVTPCSEDFASHRIDLYLWTWVQIRISWTPPPLAIKIQNYLMIKPLNKPRREESYLSFLGGWEDFKTGILCIVLDDPELAL